MLKKCTFKFQEEKTDEFQPLNCRIFGALKAQARSRFYRDVTDFIMPKFDEMLSDNTIPVIRNFSIPSTQQSSEHLEIIWERLRPDQICSAWDKAFERILDNQIDTNQEEEEWGEF